MTDADSTVTVGGWHPDSRITVTYEPAYAEDESFSRTYTAAELGYNLFRVGQPMQVSVKVTDDAVRLTLPGGEHTTVLGRADEGAHVDAQTAAYRACVADVPATWSTELAAFLDTTAVYNKAWEENWGGGGTRDLSDWGARAKGMADDLFVAQSEILTNTPRLDSIKYEYSTEVSTARDAVWDAMTDLGLYWDDYSTSLYNAYNYPAGQLVDLFPRENSMIQLGQDALWEAVADLTSAINSGDSAYCRAKYPDAQ